MFQSSLQQKIDAIKSKRRPVKLGELTFDSPLILAPMASICNAPFRLLMEELGAGGTVSELISCHGINYKNEKTLEMLRVDSREKNVGIQLFGEDKESMAMAAQVAQDQGAKFIDINMGCPVRKVVTKGGGSALLKNPQDLGPFFRRVIKDLKLPLTIKIRMGWDADQINADEIIHIAKEEGINMVAIHGRTRAQQYTGTANWDYIEKLAEISPLPLIGNGDLHTPNLVTKRLKQTRCPALMIARGALRNPFIFLEALDPHREQVFTAQDYWPVVERLYQLICEAFTQERTRLIQIRKLIVWFASGMPHSAKFRGMIFESQDLDETMKISQDYFLSLGESTKLLDLEEPFMTSGHG